jgi:hypothetical protein
MNIMFSRLRLAGLLSLVAACDTGTELPGDSPQLEARVVLENHDGSGLIPALAFRTHAGLEVVEVDARGSFPNEVRFELSAPPPAAARIDAREDRDLPPGVELAIAYVAAVPADHLKKLAYAHSFFAGLPPTALAACATATPACQRVERWCVDDTQRECRTLGFPCVDGDTCEPTVSEGDPAIIDRPSDALAGLSERIVIMWTRDGLPASSIFSRALGLKQDLKPGYNLVELGEPRPDESDDDGDCVRCDSSGVCTRCDGSATTDPDACTDPTCRDPILAEALARYNAAHGTEYAGLDAAYAELDAPGAGIEALIAFEDEVWFYVDQISVEQGIDISELVGTRVIEDWNTPIVITISPDVDPIF